MASGMNNGQKHVPDAGSCPSMVQITVVITTLNRKEQLLEAIESVHRQTWQNRELIVVDDGSIPPIFSAEEVESLGIRYIYKENSGQAASRNVGIGAANGSFIAFLDDDDLWYPRRLEMQMALVANGARWVAGDCRHFDGKTGADQELHSSRHKPYSGRVFRQLLRECFIASPTILVERDLLLSAGGFFEARAARYGEDWFMWLRLAAMTELAWVNEPIARYRNHGASMLGKADLDQIRESHRIGLDLVYERLGESYRPARWEADRLDYAKLARIALSVGNRGKAYSFLKESFRHGVCVENALALLSYVVPEIVVNAAKRIRSMNH